jgi:hypothetical protein
LLLDAVDLLGLVDAEHALVGATEVLELLRKLAAAYGPETMYRRHPARRLSPIPPDWNPWPGYRPRPMLIDQEPTKSDGIRVARFVR